MFAALSKLRGCITNNGRGSCCCVTMWSKDSHDHIVVHSGTLEFQASYRSLSLKHPALTTFSLQSLRNTHSS